MRRLLLTLCVVSALIVGAGCASTQRSSTTTATTGGGTGRTGPSLALVYDGSAWHPAPPMPATPPPAGTTDTLSGFDFVSCTAPADCMVAGSTVRHADGHPVASLMARLSGGAWSAVDLAGPVDPPVGLSCAGAGLCVAVGSQSTYMYDGRAWTAGPSFPGNGSRSIACAPPDFCVEVQPTTFLYETLRGGRWSQPARFVPLRGTNVLPGLLSCSGPDFCVGLSDLGIYWTYDGTGWSAGARLYAPGSVVVTPQALSCAGPRFCTAVWGDLTGDDEAIMFDGTHWTAPTVMAHHAGYSRLASVSCPTAGWCMAVGSSSEPHQDFAVVYRQGRWSPPVALTGTEDAPAVSCAGPSFCLAITGAVTS